MATPGHSPALAGKVRFREDRTFPPAARRANLDPFETFPIPENVPSVARYTFRLVIQLFSFLGCSTSRRADDDESSARMMTGTAPTDESRSAPERPEPPASTPPTMTEAIEQ